ncbi:acyltransferase, partial [Mesorhizobium sp. M0027]|uniref:acyltransferase family protein n=2 Tax=Mesorhizobium TaxID=68287 RepID=UPI003337D7CC
MNIIPENDHAAPRRVQQYTSVQILRGLAALMVVIYHLPAALGMLDLGIPILNSGVDLFFVISGFVMVLSTENRRRDHRAFLMQRFTRVVPFYWVMTFVMVAALWLFAGRAVSLEQLTNSLLFIPYLDTVTGYVQPVLGVGWTLNLEILFYILFAATMGLGTLTQMAMVGVVFAIAVAARIIFKPAADTVLFFYTTPILFEFLAGMALGHLVGRLARSPAVLGVSALVFAIVSMLVMGLGFNLPRTLAQGIPAGNCQEFCARGRFRHWLTNLSPKTTANWV